MQDAREDTPVLDSVTVLGVKSELERVTAADRARARAAVRALEDLVDDPDETSETLEQKLDVLAGCSGAKCYVAYESEGGERALAIVDRGRTTLVEIVETIDGRPPPEPPVTARLRDGFGADDLRPILAPALADRAYDDVEDCGDPGVVRLPSLYVSAPRALRALAKIAPALGVDQLDVPIEVGRRRAVITLDASGARLRPIELAAGDGSAEHLRIFRELAGITDQPLAAQPVAAGPALTPNPSRTRSAARPLASGNQYERFDAIRSLVSQKGQDAVAELIAALNDPGNAGATAAETRLEIYRELAKLESEESAAALLEGLEHESGAVLETIVYGLYQQRSLMQRLPALVVEAVRTGKLELAERMKSALAEALVQPEAEWLATLDERTRRKVVWKVE